MRLNHSLLCGRERSFQITRIYEKLTETFSNPTAMTEEIDRVLEAMELIAPLSENEIAQELSAVPRRHACSCLPRLLPGEEVRQVLIMGRGTQDILVFLDHQFDLATRGGQNQDEPIQDDKPFQLRKVDRRFNTPHPIMEPDQMRSLCVDWASAVDGIEHTYDVQKATLAVLFGMINSSHWRPHIVVEKWKLLEYFTSILDDSQPLKRCIDNPGLMEAIKNVANPAAMVLWLAILWLKYKELIPEVREQLEAVTKEAAQGRRRTDLDMYLSVMDSELRKAEDALTQYNTQSTDPAAIALRTKIDNL